MQNNVVYIHLDGYLAEWLVNRFGNPVRFPSRSWENIIIARYLCKKPSSPSLPSCSVNLIPICVPTVSDKPFAIYNHLPTRATAMLIASIESIFRLDMFYSLIHCVVDINEHVDTWCSQRGIDTEHREAVRQKFYRIRRDYEKNGVFLRKKYSKKLKYIK